MALSWPNLPCALKAAIGLGKRTLGHPRQSAAGRGKVLGGVRFRAHRSLRIRNLARSPGVAFCAHTDGTIRADGLVGIELLADSPQDWTVSSAPMISPLGKLSRLSRGAAGNRASDLVPWRYPEFRGAAVYFPPRPGVLRPTRKPS